MASAYLTNLITRRDAIAVELSKIDTAAAGGLPNASGGGSGLDHQGYKSGLYAELAKLEELIANQRAIEGESGSGADPFWVTGRGS